MAVVHGYPGSDVQGSDCKMPAARPVFVVVVSVMGVDLQRRSNSLQCRGTIETYRLK
jgi:hypothetical protein